MTGIAARVMLLWGWRRLLLSFLAGCASATAMPPWHQVWVLFVTLPILVWLIDGALDASAQRRRRVLRPAFAVGWWFGFGYFLVGLHWIGNAFLVEADVFAWMMPIAVVALPAGLAFFFAAGTAVARLLWSDGPQRILALGAGLGAAEWLRGHILTGFPWNLFGQAFAVHDWPLQAASVFGVYGLTVIAIVLAAAPATLGDQQRRVAPVLLSIAVLAGLVGYGGWRLETGNDAGNGPSGVHLRIVQPNIEQSEKWRPENRTAVFADYVSLSQDPRDGPLVDVDAVIWPESATPFLLAREPGALTAIAGLLPLGRSLITGANRAEEHADGPDFDAYNSVFLIDDGGRITDRYDKMRLVPFGEMLPFERTLNALGITRLVPVPGTFRPGREARVFEPAGLPRFRALICYEAIFSGAVVDPDNRPDWLLNVTNDAWYGDSWGPWQHLSQARMRAVEEGLPLARAANTGISAMIDPYGRTVGQIPLNTRDAIVVALPKALPETTFSRYGFVIFLVIMATVTALALVGKFASRSRRQA